MTQKYVIVVDIRTNKYYAGRYFTDDIREARFYKNEKTALKNIILPTLEDYDNLIFQQIEITISDYCREVELQEFEDASNHEFYWTKKRADKK